MATEIEKTFFDTFEIEPKSVKRTLKLAMQGYDESDLPEDLKQFISSQAQVYNVYPQITDRILLELIFLQPLSIEFKYPRNIEQLKNTLLGYYIEELSLFAEPSEAEIFKQQVQALFKEQNKWKKKNIVQA